jgi:mannose-6-phosphate isomerase-like protein (cupin superfamily)
VTRDPAAPGAVDVFAYRGRCFRVLQGTERSQAAVMTIAPGADAGPEEQHDGDQIIYVVEGEAIVRIDEREHRTAPGGLVTIPQGAHHHVGNPGATPLFLLTVYAPPAA